MSAYILLYQAVLESDIDLEKETKPKATNNISEQATNLQSLYQLNIPPIKLALTLFFSYLIQAMEIR